MVRHSVKPMTGNHADAFPPDNGSDQSPAYPSTAPVTDVYPDRRRMPTVISIELGDL
jgi:hypothetical protein